MKVYNYKAKNRDGELVTGSVEASSKKDASSIINSRDLVLINLANKDEEIDFTHLETSHHVSLKELMVFNKQLAGMMNAGLSIVDSLETLGQGEKNRYFSNIIIDVGKEVEGGVALSKAMGKYPEVFSDIYLSLIRTGEVSGNLSEMLVKLANKLEKDYKLRAQIKGAMIYPAFVLITLVAVAILAVTFILPKLTPVLVSANVELPLSTRILISSSNFFMNFWYLILPFTFVLIIFTYKYTRKGSGNLIWSGLKVKLPIAGNILINIYMVRFLSTVSILLSSGIGIVKALKVSSRAVGNIHFEKEILKAVKFVENGGSLAGAFQDSEYVTTITKKMIKAGELTGTLDTATGNLAEFYEEEVNNQINNLSKVLEPVLVIIMGIAVALFVSAVVMPLYDATTSVGGT